jgi:hypothetical protein
MGAAKAFEHRATELGTTDDERVVQSYLDDLAPGGPLRAYLRACRLGFRAGATMFLHGGVTSENFGVVPGAPRLATVDAWLAALEAFYRAEIAAFDAGHEPDPDVIARLRREGIGRLVVGHTPSGDCPAIMRDGDFELVLADNSYAPIERGSQVALTDGEVRIRGETLLDGGARVPVDFASARGETSPLGLRDRDTGELVKARLADGYLMFRAFPNHRMQQLAARDVEARALVVPR